MSFLEELQQLAFEEVEEQEREEGSESYVLSNWETKAVVLIVEQFCCNKCGSFYPSPAPTLFVERIHKRNGSRHLEAQHGINLETLPFKDLPKRQETFHFTADACPMCFPGSEE